MDLKTTLQNIGFSEKEAKIYLALLELKEALPSTISRRSGVKRPTTYVVLEQMQAKRIVKSLKKGKLDYFQPINPYTLLEKHYNKYNALEKAIPELLQLHDKYAITPQMTVFEGKEGLIRMMEDTLTSSEDLLVWADTTLVTTTILQDYYPTYIKKKVANKLWVRGVVCYDDAALKFKNRGKSELRELYLIPKEKYPFKNEINIYEDKVAIISHEDKIGAIIQNQNIAETQKSIFRLGFEYAKVLESQYYNLV